jgi:hypothetical protein
MRLQRLSTTFLCALVLSLAACGDKGVTSPSDLAGTYIATQLTTTTGGVTTNQLAAGASVTLVLAADGRTTGRLFVPASTSPAVDQSLTGTWSIVNNDIDLNSTADTFLRDMLFRVSGNTLVGDQTFGATRIQIVLTKQ